MSDATLRELERRWRESGALQDEVAWLRARLRAGDLTRPRLQVAAQCGHEASEQVLAPGGAPRAALDPAADPLAWARALVPAGKEALVQAALAFAERAFWRWPLNPPDDAAGEAALELARSWLACPCAEHAAAAAEAVEAGVGRRRGLSRRELTLIAELLPACVAAEELDESALNLAWCLELMGELRLQTRPDPGFWTPSLGVLAAWALGGGSP